MLQGSTGGSNYTGEKKDMFCKLYCTLRKKVQYFLSGSFFVIEIHVLGSVISYLGSAFYILRYGAQQNNMQHIWLLPCRSKPFFRSLAFLTHGRGRLRGESRHVVNGGENWDRAQQLFPFLLLRVGLGHSSSSLFLAIRARAPRA